MFGSTCRKMFYYSMHLHVSYSLWNLNAQNQNMHSPISYKQSLTYTQHQPCEDLLPQIIGRDAWGPSTIIVVSTNTVADNVLRHPRSAHACNLPLNDGPRCVLVLWDMKLLYCLRCMMSVPNENTEYVIHHSVLMWLYYVYIIPPGLHQRGGRGRHYSLNADLYPSMYQQPHNNVQCMIYVPFNCSWWWDL